MSASLIATALKAAQTIGGVSTIVTIGEAVAKRVGLLDKSTSVFVEGANLALDVFGAPKDSAIRPGQNSAPQLPAVGDATDPEARVICVDCQSDSGLPIVSGVAGESIVLGQCKKHYESHVALQGEVGALYLGYAQSLGLGESVCGGMPQLTSARYKKYRKVGSKQFGYQDPMAYYRDLSDWQKCVAAEKEQNASAQKQIDDAKAKSSAQSVKSAFALATQQKRYQKEIDDLKAQQAAEKDAQKRAEMQAKIDEAQAKAAAAEKLAADMRVAAKDSETQAKIEALQATINAQANKPGGMDDFMKQLVLQMMSQQQAQSQAVVADPLAMIAPAEILDTSQPGSLQYDADPEFDMQGSDTPMDPEIAELLGFPGARTLGDAQMLFDLRQGGFSDEELADVLAADLNAPLAGCISGTCGVLR